MISDTFLDLKGFRYFFSFFYILDSRTYTCIFQAGLYLWFLVFWLQPHKEERFIFPVYPLIALAGAISIDTTQRIIHSLLSTSKQYLNHTLWISGSSLLLFGIISLLRITALYQVKKNLNHYCVLAFRMINSVPISENTF